MASKKGVAAKPQIKKPDSFDLEKGRRTAAQVIKENPAWLKEMAAK
jgi:hypothetical protein